jgi:peptidoglycan/LPS O-acetylase OafA/YrhL
VVPKAVTNLTLTQAFVPSDQYSFSYNLVSWTLSDEAFFYALLPVLVWGLLRWGPRRAGSLVALAVAAWGARLATGLLLPLASQGWAHWLFLVSPPVRLAEFLAGVLLGLAFLERQRRGGGERPRGRRAVVAATALESGLIVLLGVQMYHAYRLPYALRMSGYCTPTLGAIILVFARQRGYLSAALSARPLVFLGEVSFAFYMVHVMVRELLYEYRGPLGLEGRRQLVCAAVILLTSLALSSLIYLAYEVPLRRRIVGWGRRPGPGLPPVVPTARAA